MLSETLTEFEKAAVSDIWVTGTAGYICLLPYLFGLVVNAHNAISDLTITSVTGIIMWLSCEFSIWVWAVTVPMYVGLN